MTAYGANLYPTRGVRSVYLGINWPNRNSNFLMIPEELRLWRHGWIPNPTRNKVGH